MGYMQTFNIFFFSALCHSSIMTKLNSMSKMLKNLKKGSEINSTKLIAMETALEEISKKQAEEEQRAKDMESLGSK